MNLTPLNFSFPKWEEGLSLMNEGNYEKALKIFSRLYEELPSYIPLLINLGICQANSIEELEIAWNTMEKALSLNPSIQQVEVIQELQEEILEYL